MPGIRDVFSSLTISTMTYHHLGDLGHPACSTGECGHEGPNRQDGFIWEHSLLPLRWGASGKESACQCRRYETQI